MMSAAKPIVIAVIVLLGAILITSGSATTHVFAETQPTTSLPSCTDPTGQNLPCMMVISTLPSPPNSIRCQETSGQTLPCAYATQNLSNGEQVVVITVYVPANYVFTGYGPWTVVKQVIHETTTRTKIVPKPVGPPEHTPAYNYGKAEGKIDGKYGKYDAGRACEGFTGKDLDHCITGYHDEFLAVCVNSSNGCGDAIVNYPPKPIQPSNISTPASGGPGSTCTNNCTTGTPPPVDCAKNPTDPSCTQTQTLTPSTTTPTTKTCSDGSVIDASASCPTTPASPNPSNPNTQTPPPPSDNNPPPSSSDNGKSDNNNGGNPSQSSGGGNDNSNSGSSTTKK